MVVEGRGKHAAYKTTNAAIIRIDAMALHRFLLNDDYRGP